MDKVHLVDQWTFHPLIQKEILILNEMNEFFLQKSVSRFINMIMNLHESQSYPQGF